MENYKEWLKACMRPSADASAYLSHHCLYVKISEQKLYHFFKNKLLTTYPVGTGRNPPSCLKDSLGTPTGLHEICEKIGDGEPLGMVFKGRKPVGYSYLKCSRQEQEKCLITSRILRLQGLERGVNRGGDVDTFARMVYIHGTNHEERLPGRASQGCVVLSNPDIIELFDSVDVGTRVYIAL